VLSRCRRAEGNRLSTLIESGLSSNGLLLPYYLPSELIGAVRNTGRGRYAASSLETSLPFLVFRCCGPELSTPKTPYLSAHVHTYLVCTAPRQHGYSALCPFCHVCTDLTPFLDLSESPDSCHRFAEWS